MKIFIINSVPYGSTATIAYGISKVAESYGYNTEIAFGYSKHPIKVHYMSIGGFIDKAINIVLSRVTGLHGVFSFLATKRLINQLKIFNPDIIHLHNLHGWYINIPMLVRYINRENKKVVWTLHDCWSFTGHCPYFDITNCDKWKIQCVKCPSFRKYPEVYIDASKLMFKLKRKWFTSIQNLTLVTPSEWLCGLVSQSFLREKRCIVINNGIDLDKFRVINDVRENNTKYRILGLSIDWSYKKGLDVFIKLSELLDDSFEIVLVGTNKEIDRILPSKILSIHRTQNQEDLARLYNSCDVFVNPTREENFPTVNIEALACGLPIITFDTGGSPEILDDTCGIVVPKNDIQALYDAIFVIKDKQISKDICRKRALNFNRNNKFKEYIELYSNL